MVSDLKYSIIIPYHSNQNLLKVCLQSLLNSVPNDVEIIVVANNSNEQELQINLPDARCRLIKVKHELFYPKAINLGVEHARGDIMIFCDADIYCTPGWFQKLTNFYNSRPDIGYCSSKLLDPADGSIIDFGIGFTAYNSPHPFKGRPADFSLVGQNIRVQAACAANSIIAKEVFIELGGFDERLVHSYSDIDLCLRLRERGLGTYCVHDSLVYHKGSSTIGSGMSNSLKGDTKGYYMALNAHRIKIDMDRYYSMAIEEQRRTKLKLSSEYYLVDLTTIADKQWHYDMFSELMKTRWTDRYNCPYRERDAVHISLYELFDSNIRNLRFPILFFTDDYRALRNNDIWCHLRDCSRDWVIDRNANILPFCAL